MNDGLITINFKTIENNQTFTVIDCNSISSFDVKFYKEIIQTLFAFSKIILLQISEKDFTEEMTVKKDLQLILNLISNSSNDINQTIVFPIFKDFIEDESYVDLKEIKANLLNQLYDAKEFKFIQKDN